MVCVLCVCRGCACMGPTRHDLISGLVTNVRVLHNNVKHHKTHRDYGYSIAVEEGELWAWQFCFCVLTCFTITFAPIPVLRVHQCSPHCSLCLGNNIGNAAQGEVGVGHTPIYGERKGLNTPLMGGKNVGGLRV